MEQKYIAMSICCIKSLMQTPPPLRNPSSPPPFTVSAPHASSPQTFPDFHYLYAATQSATPSLAVAVG